MRCLLIEKGDVLCINDAGRTFFVFVLLDGESLRK